VPADLVPGDLDVVARADLAVIRSALGAAMPADLAVPAGAAGDAGVRALVAAATVGATTGWLAFRPGPGLAVLDHVLVLRGRFSRLDPRAGAGWQRWGPPRELGDGWRRHDARSPVERTAPARVYLRDDSVVALVTPAEIDAVERTLERGITPELRLVPLLPPTHGTLAVRARSRSIAAWADRLEPTAGALLRAAQQLTIVLDLEAARLRGEAELRFGTGTAPDSGRLAAATVTAEHLERLRQALASAPGVPGEIAPRGHGGGGGTVGAAPLRPRPRGRVGVARRAGSAAGRPRRGAWRPVGRPPPAAGWGWGRGEGVESAGRSRCGAARLGRVHATGSEAMCPRRPRARGLTAPIQRGGSAFLV
jgi:hypothetical protein